MSLELMDSDAAFVVVGDEEKYSFELTNLREARCVRCIHQLKARSYHKQSFLARGNCAQRSAREEIRQKLCTEKGLAISWARMNSQTILVLASK